MAEELFFYKTKNKILENKSNIVKRKYNTSEKIYDVFALCMMKGFKNIALWGTGEHTKKIIAQNRNNSFCHITAILDENPKISSLDEIQVISPSDNSIQYDAVILSSHSYENIIWEKAKKYLAKNVPIIGIYNPLLKRF